MRTIEEQRGHLQRCAEHTREVGEHATEHGMGVVSDALRVQLVEAATLIAMELGSGLPTIADAIAEANGGAPHTCTQTIWTEPHEDPQLVRIVQECEGCRYVRVIE